MVGIVLVSHSRALAQALENLVRQVSAAEIPIAISGGVGDDRQEFGTDALEIMEAIQSVHSEAGVLVLMDLGSAVLSAELALELLPPEVSSSVRLCPGPIVEGAIAAAVQAGLGVDLEAVYAEARGALLPKLEQVGDQQAAVTAVTGPAGSQLIPGAEQAELVVRNLHGLHARPAARFVKTAASFQSNIRVSNLTKNKGPVSAKSLNALATLGAVQGHRILVSAQGADAAEAIQSLAHMVEEGFGELEAEAAPGKPAEITVERSAQAGAGLTGELRAFPISDGVALGPFYRYQPPLPEITEERIVDSQAEWARFIKAVDATQASIRQRRRQLTPSLGEEQAAIFDAHELILQDPEVIEAIKKRIFEERLNSAAACQRSIDEIADSYRALDDPYFRGRAVDVTDVGNQVLFALAGKSDELRIALKEPVILFAQELTPTETSQLDMSKVLGIVTAGGGPTSHSAILARALGIPAVSGVSGSFESLTPGTLVGLDGLQGRVWIEPSAVLQERLAEQRATWLAERERLLRTSQALAATSDGRRVEVVANVGNLLDARTAAENGAEGIGLLRTEFLFLTRTTPPSEDEQFQLLCQIGDALTKGGKNAWPMIVRTLDVGGDKELPYIQLAPEANPFLGVRALRLSLRKPELFAPQLRGILRAGASYKFRIMFPMVADLDEFVQARRHVEAAHLALMEAGIDHQWPIELGIMVEIPSAALLSSLFATQVDFFSIGTNDLTQYTLAAERGNPLLAGMADALHPAVLQLVSQVAQASHQVGKWTGVCGELAGDPLAIPILVGLGVDELSMNPGSVPRAKAILRAVTVAQAEALAERALAADSAEAARSLANEFYNQSVAPNLS